MCTDVASSRSGRAPAIMVRVRLAGLWILLVAVYAATLGIPAQTGMDYAGAEPHHLLAAESIVSDRDVDLADEYRERAYASWYPRELQDRRPRGRRAARGAARRRLRAADRAGLRARRRRAPCRARWLVLLALAFVLGARCWRGGWCRSRGRPSGAALVGLSPPALAASTTITPGVAAARAAGRRGAVRARGARAPAAALRVRRRAAAGRCCPGSAGPSWCRASSSPGRS